MEKFTLSAAEAEVKFRHIRTAYGRYLKRLKTAPSGSGRDVPKEFQIRLTKRRINLLAAKFLPRRPPCCLLRFPRQHKARIILTLPLSEICCPKLVDMFHKHRLQTK